MENKNVHLNSLEEAKKELLKLKQAANVQTQNWTLFKILVHCTQTIEYSMIGYPKLKPKLMQITIGKIAIRKFLRQGYMHHDLTAPVLGAPMIPDDGDLTTAFSALLDMIDAFASYEGDLKPHLLFGKLKKEDYDRYFAMHIADHLSELSYMES